MNDNDIRRIVREDEPITTTGNVLIIEGKVYPVTGAWREIGPTPDGRSRWGVVTQTTWEAGERSETS